MNAVVNNSVSSHRNSSIRRGGCFDRATANRNNPTRALAFASAGCQLRFYVNGTQVASTLVTGSYQVNGNPLWIGGNAVYGEHFQGKLDELRIYSRALSPAEIQTDMNTSIP